MHLTIGSAPDSWGVWFANDPRQTPWHRFLDEISEAGYEWMELGPFGYLPTDPKTLKQEVESTPPMLVVESGPAAMTPAQAAAAAGMPAIKNPVAEAEDQLRNLFLRDTANHPAVIAQRKLTG